MSTFNYSKDSDVITATFTGTGTLEQPYLENQLETIPSGDIGATDTLKVKVIGYTSVGSAFTTPGANTLTLRVNIVDLSGMVQDEGQSQGLEGFAFSGCTNLREITLFPNCEEIETNAFYDCNNLLKIYEIPSGMSAVTSGINTIFGGTVNQNTIDIFDIALSITGRNQTNDDATIVYDPASPKTATNVDQIYNVTATATLEDETDHQASTIFSEKVSAGNALTFTSASVFNRPEKQTTVGTVTATGGDGSNLTYSLSGSGNDNNKFSINSSNEGGALTFKTEPDYENPGSAAETNTYTVTVEVTDGTDSETQVITVNVTDVYEGDFTWKFDGVDGTSGTFTVQENQNEIGTVTASGGNPGSTLTYSLSGDDADLMEITNTVVSFKSAPDYENPGSAAGTNSYTAKVTVTDGKYSATVDITVNVTNENEVVDYEWKFYNDGETTDNEGKFTVGIKNATIGTVIATGGQPGGVLTYSLTGSDDLDINSVNQQGQLIFKAEDKVPDYDTTTLSYSAKITVTDGYNNSDTKDITVNLKNRSPYFAPGAAKDANGNVLSDGGGTTFDVKENQTAIGSITATDPDGNTLTYSLSDGDADLMAISDEGVLTFKSAPDYENPGSAAGTNSYTAKVTASDGTLTAAIDIFVNVTNVNESPTFSSSTRTINVVENETTVGTVRATDPDSGTTLTYSITGGADAGSFNIDSSGLLTFKTAPNFDIPGSTASSNTYTIIVTASDEANSATQTITVNVTNVNEAPTIDYEEFILANPFQGTAEELETNKLKVVVTNDDDVKDDTFTYQWQRLSSDDNDWANIGDATATYIFKTDDVGKSFRAVVGFTYNDGTTGSKTLDTIIYHAPPTWSSVEDDDKKATVGENYSYEPSADVGASEIYYLLESPDWLGFDSKTNDNSNSIPYSNYSLLVGRPTVAGSYDVKIAVVDDGEIYRASVLEFKITVSPVFTPPKIDYEEYKVEISKFNGTADELKTNKLKVIVEDDNNGEVSSFTYQWQISNDNGENWANIGNATSATYVFNKSTDENKYFRAVVEFRYNDGTKGRKELDSISYDRLPTWSAVTEQTAKVGETYSYEPSAKLNSAPYYYLLESPDWLGFDDSESSVNANGIPNSSSSKLVGTPTVAGLYDVEIAVVELGEIYKASVLTFKIIVPFKTKTALQTAIDKWYELANGPQGITSSTTTSSTSQSGRTNSYKTNATDEKTKFYINNFNSDPKEIEIAGELTSDKYLNTSVISQFDKITKSNLVKVEIGSKVTSIGEKGFHFCTKLYIVTIPISVTSIGKYAFQYCSKLENVTIPDTVTSIGIEAFQYCRNLRSVIIGNGITTIGDEVFSDCGQLYSVTIGNKVKTIGDTNEAVFDNCSELKYLNIPDSVKIIGSNAFENSGISTLYMSKNNGLTIREEGSYSIGGKTVNVIFVFPPTKFYIDDIDSTPIEIDIDGELRSTSYQNIKGIKKTNLVKVEIVSNVKTIGENAFDDCIKLQNVTIGDSVTSIGKSAFAGCSELKSLTIPDSVTSIGDSAFTDCEELQSVTIGDSVKSIGKLVFEDCNSLQSVTIPDSVEAIGEDAFADSGISTLYMSENNGLGLTEGSQSVGGKDKVNVVLISPEIANNYDGQEYFGNPNTWDVSLITDLSYVFFMKDQENHPDISTWDVSNVTSLQGTFSNSTFNGKLINWNVVNVSDFSYTFANNVVFNQPLQRWNIQDATTMESMFDNAYSFNQKIEPPMMQNKDGTDFPTQLTWDESKINGYLETIYGSATPQTDPTTFKGVFGMIALLKKTYLDALNGKTYNTIKVTFSEIMSKLITNQQEILEYNYTYDETNGWTKTSPTIFSKNTKDKSGDDLKEARDKLNKLRLNTIVDGMLLINRAYDMAKSLAKKDLSFYILVSDMKNIYDDVYANLPFYVAWYACHGLTTKASFLNNALTFHNGATLNADNDAAIIDQKLTDFIATNPIKSINNERRNDTYDQYSSDKTFVQFSSLDLYKNFKTAYKS